MKNYFLPLFAFLLTLLPIIVSATIASPHTLFCSQGVIDCINLNDSNADTRATFPFSENRTVEANFTLIGSVSLANLSFRYDSSDDGGFEKFYCLNKTNNHKLLFSTNGTGYSVQNFSFELPTSCILESNKVSIFMNKNDSEFGSNNLVYLHEIWIDYEFEVVPPPSIIEEIAIHQVLASSGTGLA